MTLQAHLGVLEGAGLISLAAVRPEVEYAFRHGLVQEAAYHSLVKGDRRALHHAVGETLERLHAAGLAPDLLPLLAHHFAEANDAPRALDYHTRAGDDAMRRYANAEAIHHFSCALDFALPGRASPAQLTHLFAQRGRAQELAGDYAAALETYARWEAEGRRRGDRAMSLAAVTCRVVVHAVPSGSFDAAQALALAEPALAEARALGNREAEARLLWATMLTHTNQGTFVAAADAGQHALALARELEQPDLLALTLTDISRLYAGIGQSQEAFAVLAEAAGLWRRLGNLPMLAETHHNTAALHFMRGEYALALRVLDEGLSISTSIGNAWGQGYNLLLRAHILLDRGDYEDAIRVTRQALAASQEGGFVIATVGHALVGLAHALLGRLPEAEAHLRAGLVATEANIPTERATVLLAWAWALLLHHQDQRAAEKLALARQLHIPEDFLSYNPVILPAVEAELALRRGDPAAALAATALFATDPRPGLMVFFQPDVMRVRAAAQVALGQADAAEQTLRRAHALAEAQPSFRVLWLICRALAELAERRGDAEAARRWRAEMRQHLGYLRDHIEAPDLRASFLARPDVRAALETE
jgi:tetratricopeptide (TPR) repeat protein